jgi:hypothetical protein
MFSVPRSMFDVRCFSSSEKIYGVHPIWNFFELEKVKGMDFKEPMKRLLRNARTGKFFREDGRWTKRPERALDFPHVMRVVHTCLLHGLRDVELVLQFDDKMQTVPLKCR